MRVCEILPIVVCCLSCLVSGNSKTNIILFIADDLGYGDIGCYGNMTLRTPNIDSLARDGVKLTHHLATASMCTPSRSALMTGRHQMRSGLAPLSRVRINIWTASRTGLPSSEITLAELTKQAGYKTAIFGKWHLGVNKQTFGDNLRHPLNQGFDYFYGLLGTNFDDLADDGSKIVLKQRPYYNYQIAIVWLVTTFCLTCLQKKKFLNIFLYIIIIGIVSGVCFYAYFVFNHLVLLNSIIHRNYDPVEQPIKHVGLSKRLVNEGLEFMKNATHESAPFLLVMSFVHVHTALFVSKEFEGSSSHGIYGDAVHEMDWSVGKILGYLDETGQKDNTLVYFVSDHGGHKELGTHGGYNGVFKGGKTHGAPDGGIRVPGLFRWPAVLPAGKTIDAPVSMMDIFPLVAQAVGVPTPTDRTIDGQNILPLLQGNVTGSPHEFMFHYCGDSLHATRYIPKSGKTVWKYVTHTPAYLPGTDVCTFGCICQDAIELDPPHLYDVTTDVSESNPIDPKSEQYTQVTEHIKRGIEDHVKSLEVTESQFTAPNVMWRYSLQECCKGTFPFNCRCSDPKYQSLPDMYV